MGHEQTIYVIDDDAAVRDSFAELCRAIGLPTREFDSAELFLEVASTELSGCIILDVRMPGMGGLKLQDTLNDLAIDLPIIIVTGHGEVPMSVRAIKAGAIDFLEKPFSAEELVSCIRAALEVDVARQSERQIQQEVGTRFDSLSQAEKSVLLGLADGKTNGAIAEELDVSLRTIQFRRSSIMKKLDVESKTEMIRLTRRANLVAD